MWNKPRVKEPEFESKFFTEMDEEQAVNISGGNIGVCYVVGYTCWSEGGLKIGTCYVAGIACNTKKGGL